MVVRGPAGLEAGFVTKLFIIQLKLKGQTSTKTEDSNQERPSPCDAKYAVTFLSLLIIDS